MIQGKVENLVPLLKDMIKTKVDTINFKNPNFESYEIENIIAYVEDRLNLLNGMYQDYIMDMLDPEDVLEINLKDFTYKKIN